MGSLTGTAPKATFSTQSTTSNNQSNLLAYLSQLLTSGYQAPGVASYGGGIDYGNAPGQAPQFGANLQPLQQSALGGMQSIADMLLSALGGSAAGQPTGIPQATSISQAPGDVAPAAASSDSILPGINGNASGPGLGAATGGAPALAPALSGQAIATLDANGNPIAGGGAPAPALGTQQGTANAIPAALMTALGFQAPQNTAPTAQATPQINAAQAFQQGVAAPLLQDFQTQVLPSLDARAGGSAGGAYSSDTQLGKATAATNLGRTLAQQGTLYDLGAQQSNQAVQQQSNLANLQSMLSTNQGNQAAALQGQGDILSAIGMSPSALTAPQVPAASLTSVLSQLLGGGATEQSTQQTQLSGMYQNFLNQLQQNNSLMSLMAGTSTAPTMQTVGVGTGGSSGLLGGLLSNAGGIASGLSTLFSDRRLKEDATQVGELDNGLPVYVYRYKGDATPRLGLMADEVERVRPEAVVTTPSGYKAVNYALAALEDL